MKIEQRLDGTQDSRIAAHAAFKNLVDFLDAHTGTTRVAHGYGSGSVGSPGSDHWDGANPYGTGAFAVYRFDTNAGRTFPWYLFVGMGPDPDDSDSMTEWRHDGTTNSSTYGMVVLSAAVGIGGDENPWGGSENNDGTDTIPSPTTDLWVAPGGGGTNVKVIPASNSSSGSGGAEDQNEVMSLFYEQSSTDDIWRAHYFSDDDVFFACKASEQDPGRHSMVAFGWVENVNPNLSHPNPVFGYRNSGGTINSNDLDAQDYDGGVTHSDDAEVNWPASEIILQVPSWTSVRGYIPNQQTNARAIVPIDVITDTPGERCYVGTIGDMIRMTRGPAPVNNSDLSQVVLGDDSGNEYWQWVLPWDGTTPFGSGLTREGVDA
jgi:hypothetical protein